MNNQTNTLTIKIKINEQTINEIGKKLNTTPENIPKQLTFNEFIQHALAIKIHNEFKKTHTISWELALCIAKTLTKTLTLQDKKLHEIYYLNGLLTPNTQTELTFKITINIPVNKQEFKKFTTQNLKNTILQTCKMNEITTKHLENTLNTIIT